MQYSKSIYQSRPPLQHTPYKFNNFIPQKQQKFILKSRRRLQDTEFTDGNADMQYGRRNSRSCKRYIYEIQNQENMRRPKQFCPLSKVKTIVDEQVLRKSRDYVYSSQFNNYVNAVRTGSKNRQDLIENMKKARTNNIYLPISEDDLHRPTLNIKSHQRRPIFNKNNNNENADLFASFELTIDHLSKIQEKEADIIQKNNIVISEQKENTYAAANINTKHNQHAILIKDEDDDQFMNRINYKQNKERTPPINRSPIFATYNRQADNILKIGEQSSMTKRKKTVIHTPTNGDSSTKFVDYEEIEWLRKRQKTENGTNKSKYQYLAKQNCRYQVQNQRPQKQSGKKITRNKITQSQFSTAYQNSLPTTKGNSIYDVDFKLQRPTGNTLRQANFRKQQLFSRQIMKPQKKEAPDRNKQNLSNSKSHSRGKLSVITASKYSHFH